MGIEVRNGEIFLEIEPGSHVYLEVKGKEPLIAQWDELMIPAVWLHLTEFANWYLGVSSAIMELRRVSSGECKPSDDQRRVIAEQFTILAAQLSKSTESN